MSKAAASFAVVKTKWEDKCDSTSWCAIYIKKTQLASYLVQTMTKTLTLTHSK